MEMTSALYIVLGVGGIAFFIALAALLERWLGRKRGNGPRHSIDHYLSEVEATSRFPHTGG